MALQENNDLDEIICHASAHGRLDVLEHLASIGVNVGDYNDAFACACEFGHLDIVKYFVSQGVDPRAYNHGAIRDASLNGHLDIVKYLTSFSTNEDRYDDEICYASLANRYNVVYYLISMNFYNKSSLNRMLCYASFRGNLRIVKYLVSVGASCYADNSIALYNLFEVGSSVDFDTIKYLVMHGADVRAINDLFICKLVLDCYFKGQFDCAIKLSKHKNFNNETIELSLKKIQLNREHFVRDIKKNNFTNMLIITVD